MSVMQWVRTVLLVVAVALGGSVMSTSLVAGEGECDPVTAVDAQTGEEVECEWCEFEDGSCWVVCEGGYDPAECSAN